MQLLMTTQKVVFVATLSQCFNIRDVNYYYLVPIITVMPGHCTCLCFVFFWLGGGGGGGGGGGCSPSTCLHLRGSYSDCS